MAYQAGLHIINYVQEANLFVKIVEREQAFCAGFTVPWEILSC